jgi:hypothetical protein
VRVMQDGMGRQAVDGNMIEGPATHPLAERHL